MENSANWNFSVASTGSARKNFFVPINGLTNRWVHIAGVYDPAIRDMKVYLNGILASNIADTTVPSAAFDTTANVNIGRRGATEVLDGQLDEVRIYNSALTSLQISNLVSPQPLSFTLQPVSQRVLIPNSATFSVGFNGLPAFIQWFTNGVAVPGVPGSLPNFTIPSVSPGMSGMTVSVLVSNLSYSITSSNAVLSTTSDNIPPVLVSAGSADGLTIGLRFNEELDAVSVTSTANYFVNGEAIPVSSATLWDSKTIAVQLGTPITGSFTVAVTNVTDLSGNSVAANSSASGVADGLTVQDIGSTLVPGAVISYASGLYDFKASGSGMGGLLPGTGTADSGVVAMKEVTGDFDMKLQTSRLIGGQTPFAGLMMRASLNASSPMAGVMPCPLDADGGQGWFYFSRRTTQGNVAAGINPAAQDTNRWVRLRRFGSQIAAFSSGVNSSWLLMTNITLSMTDPVYLGVAATAGTTTEGVFASGTMQDYGPVSHPDREPAANGSDGGCQ